MFLDWFPTFQAVISVRFENHLTESCLRCVIHDREQCVAFSLSKSRCGSCEQRFPNFFVYFADASSLAFAELRFSRSAAFDWQAALSESESKKTNIMKKKTRWKGFSSCVWLSEQPWTHQQRAFLKQFVFSAQQQLNWKKKKKNIKGVYMFPLMEFLSI